MKFLCTLIAASFLHFTAIGQITGIVLDKKSGSPLAFASVNFKNKSIGTAANEIGKFRLGAQVLSGNDTLLVSYMGYETSEVIITGNVDSVVIELTQNSVQLDAVLIYPLSPTAYIKRAIDNIAINYPNEPFQTVAKYHEKLTENSQYVARKEGVFKSYYPSYQDTVKNQHQLLAYRKADELKELQFMKKRREKSYEKAKKKAERKKESGKEEKDSNQVVLDGSNLEEMFGGPEMILSIDLMKQREPFLDSNSFDSFQYHFEKNTVYQGMDLIVIHFKARKQFQNMKLEGNIMIDAATFAIVSIEYEGKYIIPLLIRPILFTIGLRIKEPVFEKKILYEPFLGKWYPKRLHWNVHAVLTKTHWFSENEVSGFEVGQVFVINEVKTADISPIPVEKRFVARKKMEEQVHPEDDIDWTY